MRLQATPLLPLLDPSPSQHRLIPAFWLFPNQAVWLHRLKTRDCFGFWLKHGSIWGFSSLTLILGTQWAYDMLHRDFQVTNLNKLFWAILAIRLLILTGIALQLMLGRLGECLKFYTPLGALDWAVWTLFHPQPIRVAAEYAAANPEQQPQKRGTPDVY